MKSKFLFAAVSVVFTALILFSCTKKSVLSPVVPTYTPTPIFTATPVFTVTQAPIIGPDIYEDDDSYLTAKTITVNGTVQHHGFDVTCDQDYVKFNAISGIQYTIETLTSVDTVIALYSTDGTTLIDSDDDSGTGTASRLIWTATSTGVFYVSVVHYSCSYGSGYVYDLKITSP